MANSWFRLYSEIVHDPKVQMMSETMQRRFVMLMAMRCSNDNETFRETEIAFVLRISEAEAAETKAVFLAKGFIDQDWRLVNWEKRQFVSDTSTERVKRFRNRHKAGAEGEDVPATPTCVQDETPRNVSETSPDTDTDTEQKQKQNKAVALEPSMAASLLMQRLAISGKWLPGILTDVLKAEDKQGKPLREVVDAMEAAWNEYQLARSKLDFASGAEKFFGEGKWRNKATWGWKPGQEPPASGRKYANA